MLLNVKFISFVENRIMHLNKIVVNFALFSYKHTLIHLRPERVKYKKHGKDISSSSNFQKVDHLSRCLIQLVKLLFPNLIDKEHMNLSQASNDREIKTEYEDLYKIADKDCKPYHKYIELVLKR